MMKGCQGEHCQSKILTHAGRVLMPGLLDYTTTRDIGRLNYSVNSVFWSCAKWQTWPKDSSGSLLHQPTTGTSPSPDFLHCWRNLAVLCTSTHSPLPHPKMLTLYCLIHLSEGFLHPEAMEVHSKPCTPVFLCHNVRSAHAQSTSVPSGKTKWETFQINIQNRCQKKFF